ncbi:hypothetical protein [Arthrobacter sp. H14]|uniref:hypothetical protein n=1 Tax=Arthrobacter sp. H14 TaxID=1312959 RepID=UPI00047A4BEA|nr:hypothetical protein [Arthrobacter sp. H14]
MDFEESAAQTRIVHRSVGRGVAQAETSLPAVIFYASELCEEARLSQRPDILPGGQAMSEALDDLAEYMGGKFIAKGDTTKEVFKTFAADHGYTYGSTS